MLLAVAAVAVALAVLLPHAAAWWICRLARRLGPGLSAQPD